jgi:hypothetical protein
MKKQTSRQLTPYTDSMSKSIWDKAFFMDKIEGATAVIDFGCADGAIEVLRVKPDGKKEMPASAWASGLRGNDLAWERA